MERKKRTRLPVQVVSGLSSSEHLFALMVAILGYSVTKAYLMAISPDVKTNSAAAMGCRLLQEEKIQDHIRRLYRWQDTFRFNEDSIKYQ